MSPSQPDFLSVNLADPRQDVHREREHRPGLNRYRVAEGLLPRPKAGARALELGGGTGEFSRRMQARGFDVTFVDLNEHNLRRAEALGLTTARVDLNRGVPEFEDGTFDLVVMLELIEHIVAAEFVLEETCRVLRPGGHLILSTPNFAFVLNRLRILAGKLSGDEGYHYRFFTRSVLADRLKTAGFRVDRTAHSAPAVGLNVVRSKLLKRPRMHVQVPDSLASLLAQTLIVRAEKCTHL